ncbi:MAG: VanW family protein [Candidatus Limnocylindrales bacterium]
MAEPGPPETRRPRRRVFAVAFAAGLAAVVAVSGAGVAAWDAGYDARVLPGVHVGNADLSGLDRAAATQAIDDAYPLGEGRIVLRTPDGDMTIPYSGVGRRADVDPLVDEALGAGRDGTAFERAIGEVRQAIGGTTLEPRVTMDEPALAAAIDTALAALERAPTDASITMGPEGPLTTPSALGRTTDPAPVVAAALAALRSVDAPVELVIPVDVTPVQPARGDKAVQVAMVRAQRLVRDVVIVYGKKTWTIDAATVRGWVTFAEAANGSVRPVVDTTQIAATLGPASKGVLRKATNATFLKTRGGKVIGVMAGKDGRQLKVDATVARIAAELEGRSNGDLAAPVRVAYGPLPPELTTEEAARTAPLMVKLGAWTTWFPISERNYFGANIWRPAQIINGTVLMPGKRFEWWSGVGPITSARGFGPGGVIKSDHTDPTGALGGGMCSSSTTLFNAALRAGLRINARSNHKYYINRYPLGLDATVSIVGRSVQTMSFTNDTKHPIYIRGIRTRGANGRGYVTYEIWGVPDGRKVTIGRPVVSNVRQAVTREVIVDTLPHGVRNQTEYPSDAMSVSVTRVVQDATGRVVHRDTFYTHYVLWNGRIEVGR